MKKYLLFSLFLITADYGYPQDNYELRSEVYKYLAQTNSNFNFAMLAEAYRGNTRVAFFWPCMIDSVLIDDKIIAVAFEKENGAWSSVDMFIASSDTGMFKFMQVIGGSDYKVVKPNGAPIENLGNFMHDKVKNAHKAIIKKENEKAIYEIEEFSRVFGLKTCVFSSAMTGYVMRGAKILDISEIKMSDVVTMNNTGTANLDVYFPKEAKSNKVRLVKIGTGWAIDDIK